MLEHIDMFDAKSRFSEIVRMVKQTGRAVVVTKRGEELVVIAPMTARSAARSTPRQAFEGIERLRQSFRSSERVANRAVIEEGRM